MKDEKIISHFDTQKNWSSFQVERDQLARKVIELEDQIDKLESDNLSQKTKVATYEREAKRPVQEYADFQNLNQKLQVRNCFTRSIKVEKSRVPNEGNQNTNI